MLDVSMVILAMYQKLSTHEEFSSDQMNGASQIDDDVSIEQIHTYTAEELQAATILTQTIHALFDDFVNKNGMVYKQVLHEAMESQAGKE